MHQQQQQLITLHKQTDGLNDKQTCGTIRRGHRQIHEQERMTSEQTEDNTDRQLSETVPKQKTEETPLQVNAYEQAYRTTDGRKANMQPSTYK